jgi:O-antigen/teichoic acid export membrane protein
LVVYVQLFLRLLLGLYTSRLALEALGVSDYGLYNVAAGVVLLFTFISNSLSGTTIRFVNVERGKPDGDLNRVFNACHVIHIAMALLLLLLLEVGGVYYIHHYLNVEPGREADAMFAFQVASIVSCIGVINVPFSSLFNAAEKFLFTAVVAISVKVVQLALLFWLLTYEGDRVRAFAFIQGLTELTSFVVFHYYCYRRWPEVVRWRWVKQWAIYKEMLSFSIYSMVSSIASIARGQGSQLLINYFFGTVVNGAYSVSRVFDRTIRPFANNFLNAAGPQVTQSYSSGDMERVYFLTGRIAKYCMLMLLLAFFPLWAELDFVLHVWLIKVPEGALVFSQMFLLLILVSITGGGLGQVVSASGKVAWFRITDSVITFACVPVGFIILKTGSPAYMMLVVFLLADIIWRFIQMYLMHTILRFPLLRYCRDAYLPVLLTSLPIILAMLITAQIQLDSKLWHIGHFVFILLLTVCSAYFIGLKKQERQVVRTNIKRFLVHS